MKFKVQSNGLSDTGILRKNNEDSLLIEEKLDLYMVADGMGGHAAGEVASGLAVETVRDFMYKSVNAMRPSWPFPTPKEYPVLWQRLMAAVMSANGMIYRQSRENKDLAGMGTTVVATVIENSEIIHAHVGDSRLYLFRDNTLYMKTEDHSWIQEQINAGALKEEEAERHPLRNVITRALGGASIVSVDIASFPLQPDDLLLLCTDGLTTMMSDEAIEAILAKDGDLASKTANLVDTANRMGGHDNTSVVLIRISD